MVGGDGKPAAFPNSAGIYGVYDAESILQYVGMSRKVYPSFEYHTLHPNWAGSVAGNQSD